MFSKVTHLVDSWTRRELKDEGCIGLKDDRRLQIKRNN